MATKSLAKRRVAADKLYYEIWMFIESHKFFNAEKNEVKKNAFLESFLIHTRVVLDFLENHGRKDNISCSDFGLLPKDSNFPSTDVRNSINKHLCHLSWQRVKLKDEWKGNKIKRGLIKRLLVFFEQLDADNFPTKMGRTKEDFLKLLEQ